MKKAVHTKSKFRKDLQYARKVLRQIEEAITAGQWDDIEDATTELSGVFGTIADLARDNAEGIEDFNYKGQEEIKEIRAAEVARWQKIADKVCGDLSSDYGIPFTAVVK